MVLASVRISRKADKIVKEFAMGLRQTYTLFPSAASPLNYAKQASREGSRRTRRDSVMFCVYMLFKE